MMTFSIRSFLLAISVLAVWLGALVSKSPLLIELAASGTVVLILLSLALAIWDPQPLRRAYFTGFFVLAFGNLLYASFFSAQQQTSNQLAGLIMGPPAMYGPGPYPSTISFPQPMRQDSFYAPAEDEVPQLTSPPQLPVADEPENDKPLPNAAPPTALPVPYYQTPSYQPPAYQMPRNGNYYEQREAIRAAVPTLMSLLLGLLGGCITMWMTARRQEIQQPA